MLKGIPETFAVAGETVSAAQQINPTTIHLTLSGSGAGKAWLLAANDPAIRTYQGGFANAAAGTFPS